MEKKCGKCNTTKHISEFYKHPHGKLGVQNKCKACYKVYEEQPKNKNRRLARQQQRRRNTTATRATAILSGVARSARNKNLEFTLTSEWIEEKLKKGVCEKTGIFFVFNPEEHPFTIKSVRNRLLNPFSPSIDRIDSSKGYTPDNCVVTVLMYNYAKSIFTEAALLVFCKEYIKTQ